MCWHIYAITMNSDVSAHSPQMKITVHLVPNYEYSGRYSVPTDDNSDHFINTKTVIIPEKSHDCL